MGASDRASWYESPWVMLAAGYVFPPLGMYLMWRYRDWPPWLKGGVTVAGSCLAIVSSYISGRYIWPHVF